LVPDAREWRALGITRSGVLFYEEDADATNVYTAVLDLAGARTVSPPKPVLERPLLSCTNPSWSEDGSRLVFTASASTEPEGPFLIIYVPGTGSTREFRPSLKMLRRPQWSEHDAAIMAPATDSGGTAGTFRIDAVTGEPKLMRTAKELETGFEGVWTKDGKTLFNRYTVWQRGIFRMNMASGERKVLYVPPAGVDIGTENLALSPDGSTLAFHARNDAQGTGTLMLMPAEGGQPQALLTIHKPESFVFGSFAWVPDGRSILCSRTREAGSEIWRVPVDGSTPTRIEFPLVRVANLRLNRDGKTIAFMNSSLRSEIWVLRNFL
jgi:Tol biopolymer transport system component